MADIKKHSVHPVDKHVGVKLRQIRMMKGKSQEDLGNALKLTFQQIQKYETGLNRISCSKLYEIATYLKINISYFFEGLSNLPGENQHLKLSELDNEHDDIHLVEEKEIMQLARLFCNIEEPKVRKKILSLVKLFAENQIITDNKNVNDALTKIM